MLAQAHLYFCVSEHVRKKLINTLRLWWITHFF